VELGHRKTVSRDDYANFFEVNAKERYRRENEKITRYVNHKLGRPKPWKIMKEHENKRFARIFLAWGAQ
jgi:hypothetical protein